MMGKRHDVYEVRQELFFFFQAEDGIRDFHVTGVQTCALPIFRLPPLCEYGTRGRHWGSHVSESHGRDSVRRRGRADYPNLAGKANQWSVIGGQFRALSSRYSSFNFKLSGPPDKDL